MEHPVTVQPAIGSVDQPQTIYLGREPEPAATRPDINEAQQIRWFELDEAVAMTGRGEIIGASTVLAVYRALQPLGDRRRPMTEPGKGPPTGSGSTPPPEKGSSRPSSPPACAPTPMPPEQRRRGTPRGRTGRSGGARAALTAD